MDFSRSWVSISEFFDSLERNYGKDGHILMQYTGLKDKNGKEIYEGDIVKYTQVGYFGDEDQVKTETVIFNNSCFWVTCGDNNDCPLYSFEDCELFDDIEVIGNIYEDPIPVKLNKTL
jgi:uncharacterized phage protein (TIGR01671 family)